MDTMQPGADRASFVTFSGIFQRWAAVLLCDQMEFFAFTHSVNLTWGREVDCFYGGKSENGLEADQGTSHCRTPNPKCPALEFSMLYSNVHAHTHTHTPHTPAPPGPSLLPRKLFHSYLFPPPPIPPAPPPTF